MSEQPEGGEAGLGQDEDRLRMALAGADLGMWDWDIPADTAVFNERWASMLGFTLAEIQPRTRFWEQHLHPDDSARTQQALRDHLEGKTESYQAEFRLQSKSGGWVWVLARGRVLRRDREGKPQRICGTHLDITDRKKAEEDRAWLQEQLAQAQKIESIGQLAGGVAHDFNNMLGVIIGHATMGLESVDRANPLYATLTEIHKAAQRSAALTRQLLAFARKQATSPRVLDLNASLEGGLELLQRLIGENIDLEWRPTPGLWPVRIDPVQIDQVLANLCANSRDAIGGIGKVTISARNVAMDAAACERFPGGAPGDYVCLSVSDTGPGLSPDVRAHLFEPFFTTKAVGKGTGMGLATVYGIVKQNGGFIRADGEERGGTTFRVDLPRHAGPGEPSRRVPPSRPPVKGGRETLLLVEDEPSILKMTVGMLESLGYAVMAAGSPAEAMRLAERNNGAFQLLISDVVMPEMNGLDLARALCSRYPGLRALLMSGYTANVLDRQGRMDPAMGFMAKPFSVWELGSRVRDVLDSGTPAPPTEARAGMGIHPAGGPKLAAAGRPFYDAAGRAP